MIITKWANYHSHTNYCDGVSNPEDYIRQALQSDLLAYGFSSHAPLPFECSWSMKEKDLPSYFNTINVLKEKYKGDIQIYCGLEVDYIPGITGPKNPTILSDQLDYTVGSVHFVDQFKDKKRWEIDNTVGIFELGLREIFDNDIQAAIKRYYELTRMMVIEETPDIIGHLDKIKMHNTEKIFFDENEEWYKMEVLKTLAVIKESGAIVEVNTRGSYKGKTTDYYPSNLILREIKNMSIPITISSDAHRVEEIILGFPEVVKTLAALGFTEKMILNNGEWKAVAL